jgi:hypothetical protein
MRGKLTPRKDGALLVYEFDDPRELEDFSSGTYPALARQTLSREQSDDVPFHVEEGRLVGRGQASLRSLVEFAAPLTVRYSLEFADPEGSGPGFAFALGICDDGLERFLWAVGMQRLECYDMQELTRTDEPQEPIYMDRPYALELRNDGSVATLLCEGEPQSSLKVGTRKSGRFFLCASSDKPVRIERLQIEGRFSPASLERLKSTRIEQELARF